MFSTVFLLFQIMIFTMIRQRKVKIKAKTIKLGPRTTYVEPHSFQSWLKNWLWQLKKTLAARSVFKNSPLPRPGQTTDWAQHPWHRHLESQGDNLASAVDDTCYLHWNWTPLPLCKAKCTFSNVTNDKHQKNSADKSDWHCRHPKISRKLWSSGKWESAGSILFPLISKLTNYNQPAWLKRNLQLLMFDFNIHVFCNHVCMSQGSH